MLSSITLQQQTCRALPSSPLCSISSRLPVLKHKAGAHTCVRRPIRLPRTGPSQLAASPRCPPPRVDAATAPAVSAARGGSFRPAVPSQLGVSACWSRRAAPISTLLAACEQSVARCHARAERGRAGGRTGGGSPQRPTATGLSNVSGGPSAPNSSPAPGPRSSPPARPVGRAVTARAPGPPPSAMPRLNRSRACAPGQAWLESWPLRTTGRQS